LAEIAVYCVSQLYSLLRIKYICYTIALLALLCCTVHASVPEAYSVTVNGKKYKLVYLLATNDRLAVNEYDLAHWRMLDKAGDPAAIPGVDDNLKLYWLDEITGFDLQFDQQTKIVRLKDSTHTIQSELVVHQKTKQSITLMRGWGADLTYGIGSFSRPGDTPLSHVTGEFGVSMGRFGRVSAVVEADNQGNLLLSEAADLQTELQSDLQSDVQSDMQWQARFRDIRFQHDFDSGYQLRIGQLTSNRAGLSNNFDFIGVSLDTKTI